MPALGKFVRSKDGTQIWTHAVGNPTKPAIVFIPGFSCTALAFEKQFDDPKLLENLYLVSRCHTIHLPVIDAAIPFIRFVMTPADRVRVGSLSRLRITTPRDTPMISKLLLTSTNSQNRLSADGGFGPDDFNARC